MKKAKVKSFFLHYGDVTDSLNISQLITKINPDEIYNLAAQSQKLALKHQNIQQMQMV